MPQGHGKQKLIIPRMLEDKLRQKMGCGVYRTVHIAHDGAGRAESMTASYEGRIGAVHVEASLRIMAQGLGHGGLRDAVRKTLESRYDRVRGTFSTFVVGDSFSVCERAAGVAMGVSESLFAKARADVTRERPLHCGRKKKKTAKSNADK